jgi:hypothetical protein
MRGLRLGPHFTVFVLFFGLALIEAIEGRRWSLAALFAALALLSLRADVRARRDDRQNIESARHVR